MKNIFDPFVSRATPMRWSATALRCFVLFCILGLMGTLQSAAHATVFTFTGGSTTSGDIEDPTNYTPNGVPADSFSSTGDTITVSATATRQPVMTKDRGIAGITFLNAAGVSSLSGAFTLTVGATGVTNNTLTTGTTTIFSNITLGAIVTTGSTAAQPWAIGVSSGSTGQFIVNGALNYSTYRIQKTGSGILVLNGANTGTGSSAGIGAGTYNSTFRIDAGIVEISSASAFGNSTGTITSGVIELRAGGILRSSTPLTIPNIIVNGSGVSGIGGSNALTLSGAYIVNTAGTSPSLNITNTAATTISGMVSLSDTTSTKGTTISVASTATISGVIRNSTATGAAASGITKTGTGTLTISGDNTYTGATTISAGTLAIGASERIADASPVALGGGTLNVNDFNETAGALSQTASSTLDFGSAMSAANTVTFASAGTFTSGTTLTINNYTMGSDRLFITNAASATTQVLQIQFALGAPNGTVGARINATTGEITPALPSSIYYSGQGANGLWTNVANWADVDGNPIGRIPDSADQVIFPANNVNAANLNTTLGQAFTIRGLDFQTGSPVTVGGTNTLTIGLTNVVVETSASAVTISSAVAGTASVTKNNAALLTLSGTNTYTGATTINAGTLTVSGGNAIVNTGGGSVVVANAAGAIFNVATSETVGSLSGGGTMGGEVSLQAGTVLTANNANTSTTFAGVISGAGGLAKAGGSTLTLTGANTFAGGTSINAGVLNINADAALGAVPASATTNLTFTANGTLQAGATGIVLNANRSVVINSGVTSTFDFGANTLTINGSISNTGTAANPTLQTASGNTGILTLAGSNSFVSSSIVKINGGILRLTNSNALGTNPITVNTSSGGSSGVSLLDLSGNITIGTNVTLNAAGRSVNNGTASEQLRSFSGNNTFNGNFVIAVDGGGYQIESANATGTLTLGGTIKNDETSTGGTRVPIFTGAGNGIITGPITNGKSTTGATFSASAGSSWSLNGTNTYTGPTMVNSGTLLLNGSTVAASAVSVNNSAILGGSGTVNGSVTFASGATHAPGGLNNGTAIENTGAYSNAGTLAVDIAGTTAGTNYDQANVTGTVTLGGKLQVTLPTSYTPTAGTVFTIVNNDGTDAVVSTFNNLPEGGFVNANNRAAFSISYVGGTNNNDVTLTASANTAPTLEKGVMSASVNQGFSYPIVGQDADAGDTLSYALASPQTSNDGLPAGVTLATNGTLSGTPTVSGVFYFSVTVTDSKAAIATARFGLTVVNRTDGVGPIVTHSVIPSTLTNSALRATTLTGTARDIAPTNVTPVGVQRAQIQLRRTRDGYTYNGSDFTPSQTPFYLATIDAADPNNTGITRNYQLDLSLLVPSNLEVGESYSLYVLARDNAVNYGGSLIPFTITAPAPAMRSAPSESISGSGGNS